MRNFLVNLTALVALVTVLAACAPDPRRDAEADRVRAMTQITATAAAIQAQGDAAELEHQQRIQAERELLYRETAQAAADRARMAVQWLSVVGIIVGCVVLLGFGRLALAWQAAAARQAAARAAHAENVVTIVKPGQAPWVLLKTGRLLNAATGQVIDPSRALPADPQQVMALSAAQIATILTAGAENISRHPQSTAADILPAVAMNLPDPGVVINALTGGDETSTGLHPTSPDEDQNDAYES